MPRGRPRKAVAATADQIGPRAARSTARTTVTFSPDELTALADYIAAGLVMLRVARPHAAVSKLKAAMSRLKLTPPRGL